MRRIESELKTKNEINEFSKDEFYSLFKENERYNEFISNLYQFIIKDPGYIFYIHRNKDIIMEGIRDLKSNKELTQKEKLILSQFEILDNLSFGTMEEFKTQYGTIKLYDIRVPRKMQGKLKYDNIISKGYENVQKIRDFELYSKLRELEELKSDIYFLTTVNLILNDYPNEYDDFVFEYIKRIISYPNEEKFNNYKERVDYHTYQAKTLRKFYKVEKNRNNK